MPAPTGYSETELATYLVNEIGAGLSASLSITVASPAVVQAITDIERLLGVSDVSDVTDLSKLEAVTRWWAWRVAEAQAISQFDVTLTGGKKFLQNQQLAGIRVRLGDALSAVGSYPDVPIPGRRRAVPTTGLLTRTAPVMPELPPDAGSPDYSGSPYSPGRRMR